MKFLHNLTANFNSVVHLCTGKAFRAVLETDIHIRILFLFLLGKLTKLNISAVIFQIVMQQLFRFILITTGVQVLPRQNLGFLQVLTELRAHFLATEKERVMLILLPWHLICGLKVLTLSLISTI